MNKDCLVQISAMSYDDDDGEDVYYTCSVCALDVCFQCTGISIAMHKSFQELGENTFYVGLSWLQANFPSINKVTASLDSLDRKMTQD